MKRYELAVEGLACTGCEETVSKAVRRVDGVYRVETNHETGEAEVTAEEGAEADVKQAIHDTGYDLLA